MNSQKKEYENIAVIKLSSLGDIVHAVPAFGILRKGFPHAKISWFSEAAGAKLLKSVPGIDEIVVLNLKAKGFFKKLREIKRVLSAHRKTFDLVIDFQGLLKSAALAWLLKGPSLGFGKKNLKEQQARFFYRHKTGYFDETQHVIFKNIHMIRDLVPAVPGNPMPPGSGPALEYPLKTIPMPPGLKDFSRENGLEKNHYVIVNVGGGWESKLMSAGQYAAIIQGLKKYKTVILWGNEKEKAVARHVSALTGARISPFFDFNGLILFIRDSRLIVSGDTLPLHLADMVGTPSVGIFGPTSPGRNGSLLEKSVSIYEKLPCSFCYKKKCGTIRCIKIIDSEKIIKSIERVYEA